jgi:hypothetical protein
VAQDLLRQNLPPLVALDRASGSISNMLAIALANQPSASLGRFSRAVAPISRGSTPMQRDTGSLRSTKIRHFTSASASVIEVNAEPRAHLKSEWVAVTGCGREIVLVPEAETAW